MKVTREQLERAIDSAEPVKDEETIEQFKARVFKNLSLMCSCFFTKRQAEEIEAEIDANISGWMCWN